MFILITAHMGMQNTGPFSMASFGRGNCFINRYRQLRMVGFDFARPIWRRHDDCWSAHNTLLIHGFENGRQNWRHRKIWQLARNGQSRLNASSPAVTVKLYPIF